MPTPAIGPFTDDMSFLQRTLNFVILNAFGVVMDLFYYPWVDEILTRENGGVELTAKSLMKEASLFFLNIIPAMELPAPKPPVIVDVGGMHCRSGKPVPKEYDDWIRKQKNGFIYFSLGSAVKGKDMPERFRVLFLNVFRELKQYQILWKWESEMADTPSNVKVSSWMPQQDLLARSDIKLFITHGGLLSIQESTYHSVPVVGIAVGADQMLNMKKVEHSGAGLAMTWDEITEEKLLHAIRTVIGDPSFKHNVSRMSAIMKDELEGPLDRAVFWTEYVIRHQGAHHLKSAARNLTSYQEPYDEYGNEVSGVGNASSYWGSGEQSSATSGYYNYGGTFQGGARSRYTSHSPVSSRGYGPVSGVDKRASQLTEAITSRVLNALSSGLDGQPSASRGGSSRYSRDPVRYSSSDGHRSSDYGYSEGDQWSARKRKAPAAVPTRPSSQLRYLDSSSERPGSSLVRGNRRPPSGNQPKPAPSQPAVGAEGGQGDGSPPTKKKRKKKKKKVGEGGSEPAQPSDQLPEGQERATSSHTSQGQAASSVSPQASNATAVPSQVKPGTAEAKTTEAKANTTGEVPLDVVSKVKQMLKDVDLSKVEPFCLICNATLANKAKYVEHLTQPHHLERRMTVELIHTRLLRLYREEASNATEVAIEVGVLRAQPGQLDQPPPNMAEVKVARCDDCMVLFCGSSSAHRHNRRNHHRVLRMLQPRCTYCDRIFDSYPAYLNHVEQPEHAEATVVLRKSFQRSGTGNKRYFTSDLLGQDFNDMNFDLPYFVSNQKQPFKKEELITVLWEQLKWHHAILKLPPPERSARERDSRAQLIRAPSVAPSLDLTASELDMIRNLELPLKWDPSASLCEDLIKEVSACYCSLCNKYIQPNRKKEHSQSEQHYMKLRLLAKSVGEKDAFGEILENLMIDGGAAAVLSAPHEEKEEAPQPTPQEESKPGLDSVEEALDEVVEAVVAQKEENEEDK
ncbi:unnamed protein product [Cyprideis torosa]|uniref:Uncharacterized protein n=1 Tax=Cyprideis torosa TaxID=163714 RepID=A0A7R8ZJV3_9CRUS|nr:unnamed protein product [Cyprideis torosa]CAG0883105.1 unnamed protein product [Cyprideis torosa]